jgi:hypothetical protein
MSVSIAHGMLMLFGYFPLTRVALYRVIGDLSAGVLFLDPGKYIDLE